MKSKRVFLGAGATILSVYLGSAGGVATSPGTQPLDTPAVNESSSNTAAEPSEKGSSDEGDPDFEVFQATAYCDFGITFSGVLVNRGIVAADPRILPIGSVIEVEAGPYSGIYTVMDTGGLVKGRIIDIYMPDYEEAIQFGRQDVRLKVIRRGWHPDADAAFEDAMAG